MALTKPKYPLDRTGVAVSNLVQGEERQVEKQYNRAFAPYGGPFYGDGVVVTDKATGKPLTLGTDYQLIYPYTEAIQNLGKPVYQLINLVNKAYDNVILKYQVVGGPYSYSIDSIVKLINDIQQDDRVVSWGNVWGKPLEFNPSAHLHAATDLYGLEYVVLALEELTRSVIQGDVASHNVIYDYINRVRTWAQENFDRLDAEDVALRKEIERLDGRCDDLQNQLNATNTKLTAHINDKSNPHNTTKAQVGLGSVENYRVATTAEAQQGTLDNLYMTPLKVWQAITQYSNANIIPVINAHINDKNNPHNTTKAQVGLDAVENYRVATQAEAEAGASNVLYMTPLRTAQAINRQAGALINAHINDKNNPHNTTKGQVGLGNVQDYPPANDGEAQAGVASDRYLTPRGGKIMYDYLQSLDAGQVGVQNNAPLYGSSDRNTNMRVMYRINGANFARLLTSNIRIRVGSGDRQYYNIYVGGDGIADQLLWTWDTQNNGRSTGYFNLDGISLPAVGVGNSNYLKILVQTTRGTQINAQLQDGASGAPFFQLTKASGQMVFAG